MQPTTTSKPRSEKQIEASRAELHFFHDMAQALWRGLHKTLTDRIMATLDAELGNPPNRCVVALTNNDAHAAQILPNLARAPHGTNPKSY